MEKIEQALIQGDLANLTTEERIAYYKKVCESLGLNPLTRPFDYIKLNNKLQLYARKDATDQLRKIHKISIRIVSQNFHEGLFTCTVEAADSTGRIDSDLGVVPTMNLKGEALSNAIMKGITKAKRRVTLSIAGLAILDESEVESLPPNVVQLQPQQPIAQLNMPTTETFVETIKKQIAQLPDAFTHEEVNKALAYANNPNLTEAQKDRFVERIKAKIDDYMEEAQAGEEDSIF